MGRRSDHSREELYEMTVAAARGIVEDHGFRALTVRKIADAIGYSPGTIYNLFDNLDDLIIRLNGGTLDELFDRLSAIEGSGDPTLDLDRLLGAYLAYLDAHPSLWNLLFEHTRPEGQVLPKWYVDKVADILGLLEQALSPHFPEDRANEKRHAARVLWASLHGICSLSQAGKLEVVTTQAPREMARLLVSIFLAGLETTLAPNVPGR
jgi:AcrR family transcriptional regulator